MDTMPCPSCFSPTPRTPCSSCGWQPPRDNPPPALPLGRVLDNRYRIGRVLGHGGFGITYLIWDENLHLRLALKEYLPRDCATRAPDGSSVAIYSGPAAAQFAYGLDRFLEEARALAHFDQHPGIVTVKNFFRAHGTGYCVMDYVDGITLRDYLEQQPGGRISFDAALKLLMPVMDALRAVHKEGLLHRDIAPDNIYLTQDGRIKLLDFGAARFAAGEHSKSLSVILKPGYAPEEQYRTRGHQGPWTDVYGLAATLYRAITGQVPPEALDRLDKDELIPPTRLGSAVTPGQEAALLQGLAVKAGQRFADIVALQQALRTREEHHERPVSVLLEPDPSRDVFTPKPAATSSGLPLVLGGGLVLAVTLVNLVNWHESSTGTSPPVAAPAPESPAATRERPRTATPVTPATSPPPTGAPPTPSPEPSAVERGKSPIYFAAELAPTDKIPPEAPLCYKFLVAGPEEQLNKLKGKYPDLYDYRIVANLEGGKNLVAKRRDAAGQEIAYFYSTSPAVCNHYQQARLGSSGTSPAAGDNSPGDRGMSAAPVERGSPRQRYRFLGKDQEIVEDTATRLHWQRCSLGQTWNGVTCAGEGQKYRWIEAQRLGSNGWRLPTKEELSTLVHCSSSQPDYWPASRYSNFSCEGEFTRPTLLVDAFPNTPDRGFWSSSPNTRHANGAWIVYFSDGHVDYYSKDYSYYVRLVRGGQ